MAEDAMIKIIDALVSSEKLGVLRMVFSTELDP